MAEALHVLMFWLHISGVAALIGGILYARAVLAPASQPLGPEAQRGLAERTAVRFRPLVYSSIAALIVSGLYRIISTPGHSPRYHALLGVKLLLAAHVFAVSALIVKKDSPRRTRLMTGAAISGFAIIAIASYLRRIF